MNSFEKQLKDLADSKAMTDDEATRARRQILERQKMQLAAVQRERENIT